MRATIFTSFTESTRPEDSKFMYISLFCIVSVLTSGGIYTGLYVATNINFDNTLNKIGKIMIADTIIKNFFNLILKNYRFSFINLIIFDKAFAL